MLLVPREEPTIISSNVPIIEDGIDIYDSDTTYPLDHKVQLEDTIYKSLRGDLLNIDPATSPLSWKRIGKTNYYRLFDSFMSSDTTNQGSIEYSFSVTDIDTFAVFGLTASSVTVRLKNEDDEVVYEQTRDTTAREVLNWTDWTYAKTMNQKSAIFTNIPMLFSATLEIIIDNGEDMVGCGHLVYGRAIDTGLTLVEPSPISSVRNVISKSRNEYGSIITKNSMTYKRIVINIMCDNQLVDILSEIFEKYTASYCLYIGDDREGGFRSLSAYGIYKDFDMPIGINNTQYQLEIEGVI